MQVPLDANKTPTLASPSAGTQDVGIETVFDICGCGSVPGRLAGGIHSCLPAEHGAGHQAGAAGIIKIEQPPYQLAGGIETWNGFLIVADDLARMRVDTQPTEGEGDSADF